MRAALWPDASQEEHEDDISEMLVDEDGHAAFIAPDAHGDAIAFVEAALRHDYVNDCDTNQARSWRGFMSLPKRDEWAWRKVVLRELLGNRAIVTAMFGP